MLLLLASFLIAPSCPSKELIRLKDPIVRGLLLHRRTPPPPQNTTTGENGTVNESIRVEVGQPVSPSNKGMAQNLYFRFLFFWRFFLLRYPKNIVLILISDIWYGPSGTFMIHHIDTLAYPVVKAAVYFWGETRKR